MKLIHFAHRGEAQSFLHAFDLTPVKVANFEIYCNQDYCVVISGEGIYASIERVSATLAAMKCDEVINYGICGILNETDLELNEIYPVRTVYAFTTEGPAFHSYHTQNAEGLDLVTCHQRVTNSEIAKLLKPMGDLVDRELWGVARACKLFEVPFQSFKLTSDIAGTEFCLDIRHRAKEFSDMLLSHFNEIKKHNQNADEDLNQVDLYFTRQQKIQFDKLMHSLCLKFQCQHYDMIERLEITHIKESSELSDKELTQKVLEKMQQLLNPLKGKINDSLQEFAQDLNQIGANVTFDPALEKKEFKLNMTINHQTNIDKLKLVLNTLDFSKFEKIMDGQLND